MIKGHGKMNGVYTLKQLQRAYLKEALYRDAAMYNGETCMYCWKHRCKCNAPSVKLDPFINAVNTIELSLVAY